MTNSPQGRVMTNTAHKLIHYLRDEGYGLRVFCTSAHHLIEYNGRFVVNAYPCVGDAPNPLLEASEKFEDVTCRHCVARAHNIIADMT